MRHEPTPLGRQPVNGPGLEADFLEFIREPDADAHRRIHEFYVPLFRGCHRVADLACGEGAFVALLAAAGHASLGVDADPGCVARARSLGVPVVQAEVTAWLIEQPDASWDGLFCAHLVEHLPYANVLGLFRQARRVLRRGGRLVVVTPNVRALYSHLEMFYLHFGHLTFYHPHLLAFFAERAGFATTLEGENSSLACPMFGPRTPSPELPQEWPTLEPMTPLPAFRYEPDLPRRGGAIGALWWRLKMTAVRFLVRPYLDPLVADWNRAIARLNANVDAQARRDALLAAAAHHVEATRTELEAVLARLDRSFECYLVADVAPPDGTRGPPTTAP